MTDNKGLIYFGCDREGYELKKELAEFLKDKGYDIIDLGLFKEDEMAFERIDREVKEKVREKENALGLLLFGKQDEVKAKKKK